MEEQNFRDSISTVDETGKRVWIFPRKPEGKYYDKRKLVSYFLLLLLFSAPFLRIGGEPLFLFNIIERKFVIFGRVFFPQELYLFAFTMITMIVFVVLFTVAYGRIFCGWICPQTIFMEMLFRRLEYWIEGDGKAQRRLKEQEWNAEKIRKRVTKFALFYIISFLIANVFLAYIIGSEALIEIITDKPSEHIGGLAAIGIFSFIFFAVFTWMREQVCTTVCPYGRLQGVLLDKHSINITYDYQRGEPRGKRKRGEEKKIGDCVDCGLCVDVCPTGIDIRNGTQLECVNCTACIDACDNVMTKIKRPTGLIRYASENEIQTGEKFQFTPRLKAYTVALVLLLGFTGFLLRGRGQVEMNLFRARGMSYSYNQEKTEYINIYRFKLLNKSKDSLNLHFEIENRPEVKLEIVGAESVQLAGGGLEEGILKVGVKIEKMEGTEMEMKFGVYNEQGEKMTELETNFVGPLKFD